MVKGDLRQEISPEAAALLRIEAAIKGESQKEIASRLIIAGVSPAARAALQGSRKEDKLVKVAGRPGRAAQPDKAGRAEGAGEEDMAGDAQAPGGPDMAALAEGAAQSDMAGKAGRAEGAAQSDMAGKAGRAEGAAQSDMAEGAGEEDMAKGAAQGKRKNLPRLDMEPQLSRVVELWNGEANKSRLKIAKLMEYPKSTAAAAINRLIEKGVLKE